jgi:hypothetical protein
MLSGFLHRFEVSLDGLHLFMEVLDLTVVLFQNLRYRVSELFQY